ncbi:MAG: class E sortase [Acidimicrobiales bacterium]
MTDVRDSIATRPDDERLVEAPPVGDWGASGPFVGDRTGPDSHLPGAIPPEEGGQGRVIRVPEIPVRKVVAVACLGFASLVLVFLVYLLAFTPVTASRNQQRLVQSLVTQPLYRYNLARGQVPAEGSAVAVLSIPALRFHQVVVEGTSAADLMNGPGLMPGTALPGTTGNAVIAGRRVTFGAPFGAIGQLRRGDRITVVDGAGTSVYRVTRSLVVAAGQKDVIAPTTDDRLTLITSNSSLFTSGRLVVLAKLTTEAYDVPSSQAVAIPTYELGLSGDPSAGGLALFWTLMSLLLLVVAGLAIWRWRHPWLVYLLAAPILIVCGLFACESIARALPATF